MIARILAVTHARNLEFLRDRSSLSWNLLLPFLLVVGLSFVFSGSERASYKVAVTGEQGVGDAGAHPFLSTRYTEFYTADNLEKTLGKLEHHQVDMVLDANPAAIRYWVNTESPGGYFLETALLATDPQALKQTVTGEPIRYIDWLFPGILGMNMMFSCLFGVGYVVVRYRKSGFLKRLSATPLRAIEFVIAQILSRMVLVVVTVVTVFGLAGGILGVRVEGNYILLFLTMVLGAISLISIGFVISSRVTSEELAGGLLNVLSWPMMLLSGVWFSLEGKAEWLQWVANIFPLTHMLKAARGIMLDGDGLLEVAPHWLMMGGVALFGLALGSFLFRWRDF